MRTGSVRKVVSVGQDTVTYYKRMDDAVGADAAARFRGRATGHALQSHNHAHAHVRQPPVVPSENGRAPTRAQPERKLGLQQRDAVRCDDLGRSPKCAHEATTPDAHNKARRTARQPAPPVGSCRTAAALAATLPNGIAPTLATLIWKAFAWQATNGARIYLHTRSCACAW